MDMMDKMRDLLLRTPERPPRNGSIHSTPGLPMVDSNKHLTSTPQTMLGANEPMSPPSCPYPVVVPHRIFVGGFPPSTTEHELRCYFERFGTVKDVKIIKDETNENSKSKYSYGFVTFSTEEEAKHIVEMNKVEMGRAFKFQGRYLNVNEAVKKPPNKLRLDAPLAMPATGIICRDHNGQFMTVYPTYTVVQNPEPYNVVQQPQCVNMTPSMVPIVYHQPQPVYQMAPAIPQPLQQSNMAYTQVAGSQMPTGAPTPGYYQ